MSVIDNQARRLVLLWKKQCFNDEVTEHFFASDSLDVNGEAMLQNVL